MLLLFTEAFFSSYVKYVKNFEKKKWKLLADILAIVNMTTEVVVSGMSLIYNIYSKCLKPIIDASSNFKKKEKLYRYFFTSTFTLPQEKIQLESPCPLESPFSKTYI